MNAASAKTGAISFPAALIGGSLNLHIHFHTLAVDGVFEKHSEGVRFIDAKAPEKADVTDVAQRVHRSSLRRLRKHRYIDEHAAEERGKEPPATAPIDAFALLALGGGALLGKPSRQKNRPAIIPIARESAFRRGAGRTPRYLLVICRLRGGVSLGPGSLRGFNEEGKFLRHS